MKETEPKKEGDVSGQEKVPGQILSKGEERYNAISNSLKSARSKMGSWFSRAGSFLKKSAFVALETPENIAAGAEFVADKTVEGVKATGHGIAVGAEYAAAGAIIAGAAVVEGAKYTGEKIAEGAVATGHGIAAGAEFVADKTVEGVKYTGEKIAQGAEYAANKTEQFGDWVEDSAKSAYHFSAEQYQKASTFVEQKGEMVKNYVEDKKDLAVAVGSFLAEKTVEKLNIAKEGVVNNYNSAMEYGKEAVDSATQRAQKAKEFFKSKWNTLRMDMLTRKAEVQRERLEKTQRKLSQFNQVAELGNKLA